MVDKQKQKTDKMTNDIEIKLAQILTFICLNPMIFVSEHDIHYLVIRKLAEIDELNPDEALHPTKCTIGKNQYSYISQNTYMTTLMHREYGREDSSSRRSKTSDIVILNEKDVNSIDNPKDLKIGKIWIVPDYIFEFGTEKSAKSADDFKTHLEGDIEKVNKSKKRGYIVHIQRNLCRSDDQLLENNRNKRKRYEIAVIKAFNKETPKDHVHGIIIFVDIGNEGRKVRGKINIFENGIFVPVPVKTKKEEIASKIKDVLSKPFINAIP